MHIPPPEIGDCIAVRAPPGRLCRSCRRPCSHSGGWLVFVRGGPGWCASCSNVAGLILLAAGDATLTRRAWERSARRAVVARRVGRHYQRSGILIEADALVAARVACAADAEQRALARAAAAPRREALERQYWERF